MQQQDNLIFSSTFAFSSTPVSLQDEAELKTLNTILTLPSFFLFSQNQQHKILIKRFNINFMVQVFVYREAFC